MDQPNDPANDAHRVSKKKKRLTVRRLMGLVAICALVFAGLAWLGKKADMGRDAARRAACANYLKGLAIAFLQYEQAYGSFPPAYVTDATGKPLYSWRVLLARAWPEGFPAGFVQQFHWDEPWDSPSNSRLHGIRPNCFFCPSHPDSRIRGHTCYVVVVGPATMFPPGGVGRKSSDVTDGFDRTLTIVETANAGIHWMEPRDLEWDKSSFKINDPTQASISSHHAYGRRGAAESMTVDTRITLLVAPIAAETIKALLTIDGGEPVSVPDP